MTRDIAHVSAVELYTAVPDETVTFFQDLMAMEVVGRRGDSVYLHAWDDYERFTVKVTGHSTSGIGRTWLRASSPEALERRVKVIEAAGLGNGWTTEEPDYGKVFHFTDPDGHPYGIYWDTHRYTPRPEMRPSLKNQAARFPGRGANVRRLDHVNFLAARFHQLTRSSPTSSAPAKASRSSSTTAASLRCGSPSATSRTTSSTPSDSTGTPGRLHHVAFATDTRGDILRAADVFLDAGIHIETGPHKHAIQQTFFLYVWEPGGNRIELCNAGARLLLAPDHQVITWTQAERAKGQAWGLKTIDTFHTHGTPPVERA